MDITVIEAKTLPEIWFQCIRQLLDNSVGIREYVIDRGSYAGQKRREFDFVVLKIEYPGSLPLVPDTPPGVPPPATQESLEGYLPYLMTGAKKVGEDYTYGEDLERQIPEVIKMYREDGYGTNQAYMAVGSANSLFLKDPPCLRGIDTCIRYSKLHFSVYFRSWDLWAGLPTNLASLQILKEYMSSEIGVEDGDLIACSKGLHLYDHCWNPAKMVLRR